jgi:MYXO-CTERM domain-containing protein
MRASLEKNEKKGRSISLATAVVLLAAASTARAAEYYVAPTGSDSNAGTMAAPWATLQKGANTAVAGDTVWIRGGTYKITTPANSGAGINFTKSGTSDTARIKYWAYPGETPLFDFSNLQISTTGYTMGFVVNANYLHFKGLEICCVPMNTSSNNGISVNGSSANDIFELLNMHHNAGNGIFIGNKSGGGHLVLNCDAHDNYDPNSNQGMGQNADGFGVHYQTSGATTIIRGCRAWWNSDDGYDLINQDIPVTVENSWAFMNGYANYGATNPTDGNGNGFKMGSSPMMVRHLVQNNVAWKNKASGFYANHSPGGNTWYNNTSFNNGTQYNMLASPPNDPNTTITLSGALAHIMRNNVGFPNRNSNMTGVDTMFNSWDLGITPANSDFASVSDPSAPTSGQAMGMAIEGMGTMGPRQADGSMPNVDFLKLAMASRMIDKGTNVGLPYVGTAPDLGAYEYGATTTAGTGGSNGTTGTGGTAATGTGGRGGAGAGGTTGAGGRGGTTGAGGVQGTGGVSATGTGGTGVIGSGTGGSATGTAGTGVSPTGTGGTDASTGTGGTSVSPAGTGGASATGGAGGSGPAEASGGCGCAIDAGSPTGSALAIFAVSALLLRRRRRRANTRN